ncbi:YdcF family protein [Psychrobacter sp.]|uniref:YdcF family protein n=1 Tax=Psychrobacter sp. TaxID=56811 RepID=UPI0025E435B7|nr:YdcF family protein [Psychrobacter sp.]
MKRSFIPIANLVIRASLVSLSLGLIAMVGFYTPVFSNVGLWLLNHLPIPKVNHQPPPILTPSSEISDKTTKSVHHPGHISLDLSLNHLPTAYVVLGGGLTEADTYNDHSDNNRSDLNENTYQMKSSISAGYKVEKKTSQKRKGSASNLHKPEIVLNKYSLIRMQTVMKYQHINPLPIVLTGVEAAWMKDWLNSHGVENVITENASMNTCENARFTAKRLHLQDVYLITDAYHMTRARRQFALNGIHAIPIPAALPMEKGWLEPINNAQHSRRTLYELAAYARDVFAPQNNCRQASDVSFETLLRSRKPGEVKTF